MVISPDLVRAVPSSQGVIAALAVDRVRKRAPIHTIVVFTAGQRVASAGSLQHICALTAEDAVVGVTAHDTVVAGAGIDQVVTSVRADDIVPALPAEHVPVACPGHVGDGFEEMAHGEGSADRMHTDITPHYGASWLPNRCCCRPWHAKDWLGV